MKVCAVVVTFNRINLLKMTLKKLENQTINLDKIIVVNNASTDGTSEYLENVKSDKFSIINMEKNLGGAGGFYTGIKYAFNEGYDYMWIMDDDTLADEKALENLLKGIKSLENKEVGFVCSNVLFKDSKPCLMNIPLLSDVWNEYADKGILKVDAASFVSILISKEAVRRVGLPIKEFFIWGDDLEFTKRISKEFDNYMISDSIVYHYMNENKGIDIINTEPERVGRYFYEFRNKLYINKKNGFRAILEYYKYVFETILRVIIKKNKSKRRKISVIIKGVFAGIKFNPIVEIIE